MMENVFDCANSVRDRTMVCTQEEFERIIDSDEVARICKSISNISLPSGGEGEGAYREWKDKIAPLKKQLPVMLPHAHFTDNWRHRESAVQSPWMSSDFDGIYNPLEFWEKRLSHRVDELRIVLAFISPSGKGIKVVSQLPDGMTREEAQEWFAKEIGLTEWDHTHDLARAVYLVPRRYLLHYCPSLLFTPNPSPFPARGKGVDTLSGSAPSDRKANLPNTPPARLCRFHSDSGERIRGELEGGSMGGVYDPTLRFGNLLYKDICERFWEEELGQQPVVGQRHEALIRWAYVAETICDHDRDLMLKVVPRLGKPEEEIVRIVDDVLEYKKDNFRPFGKNLNKLIRKMEAELKGIEDETGGSSENDIENALGTIEDQVPQLPKALPDFIKLITSNVPDCYKPAVASQVFPALGAHLHQVKFRYIDNVEHEAGLLGVCIGQQSIGKGCVNEPINAINADLLEISNRNKELARQWRKESAESENDDTGLLPENIYFPLPLPNMTDAALTDRLRRAEHNGDRTIFTKMDEIELLYQVNTGGNLKPDRLICLAYDHADYGQERVSSNAISDSAKMRWSWCASTTPINGRMFFAKNNGLMNGSLTRVSVCTVFQPKIKGYMPVYGIYNDKFTKKVQEYVNRLNLASGLVYCKKVNNFIERLRLWCIDEEDNYKGVEHTIFFDFYKRSLVIAFRKAMVLYILSGNKWTKKMEDFIEWSLKYDLWCKLYYFSDLMISAYEGEKGIVAPMVRKKRESKMDKLYEQLPDEFTKNDIENLSKELMIFTPTKNIIYNLKKDYSLEKIGRGKYRKKASPPSLKGSSPSPLREGE